MGNFLIRAVATGFKFDLCAANGQGVLTSEVYRTAAACRKGIESVRRCAPGAPVEDRTDGDAFPLSHPKFELYRDRAGAFRFRLKARNGAIIAVSEPYAARSGCLSGIDSVKKNAGDAPVSIL